MLLYPMPHRLFPDSPHACLGVQAASDSVAAPTQAVALLNQHLQPAPALEVEKVQQLIAHLDDGNFKVREKSDGGLAAVGRARCAIARQGVGRQAELGGATRGADR